MPEPGSDGTYLTLDEYTRRYIKRVVAELGSVSAAARVLGVARSTVHRWLNSTSVDDLLNPKRTETP